MGNAAKFICKWCAIVALCVIFSEFSVRVFGVWPIYQVTGKGISGGKGVFFFTLDTELLFRMIPNDLHQINIDGFRDTKPSVSGERLITVSGDSFPMGLVVEPQQTFPNQLEALLPGREVYNLGVQGYGPDQSLIAFKRYGLPLKPSGAILTLYPSNDFDDLIKNRLFQPGGDGETLIPIHPNPTEEITPLFRLPMALRCIFQRRFLPAEIEQSLSDIFFIDKDAIQPITLERYQRAQRLMRLVVREFKRISHSHSIPLWIVVVPSYKAFDAESSAPQRSPYDLAAISISRDEGVNVIDLYDPFSAWKGAPLYSKDDKHLSVTGHTQAALTIAQAISLPPVTP